MAPSPLHWGRVAAVAVETAPSNRRRSLYPHGGVVSNVRRGFLAALSAGGSHDLRADDFIIQEL